MGSRRMRPGDLLSAQRGPLHPAEPPGHLVMPFTGGGVNWGGLAVDGAKGVVYVNSSNMLHRITLFPASRLRRNEEAFP
jgi:quinoprotein glucose dehydrogenase